MGTDFFRGVAKVVSGIPAMFSLLAVSSCAPGLAGKARDVSIQEPGTTIPASCALVGDISASDGHLSRWPINFTGKEKRAIDRLKQKAAESSANLVIIDPAKTVEEIGLDALKGSVITVFGSAYACPSQGRDF